MRTLVDFKDTQVSQLDRLAQAGNRSRASLIREAVDDYLDKHRHDKSAEGFGVWAGQAGDGLEYQKKLRSEW